MGQPLDGDKVVFPDGSIGEVIGTDVRVHDDGSYSATVMFPDETMFDVFRLVATGERRWAADSNADGSKPIVMPRPA